MEGGPGRSPFVCVDCAKDPSLNSEFSNKSNLSRHRRQAHKESNTSTSELLVCEQCAAKDPSKKATFFSKSNLLRHKNNVHKKRACPRCGKVKRDVYRLEKHLRRRHPEADVSDLPNSPRRKRERAGTELRRDFSFQAPYSSRTPDSVPRPMCHLCSQTFPSFPLMRDHWRRDHAKEIGFQDIIAKPPEEKEELFRDRIAHDPDYFITPLQLEYSRKNRKFQLSQNAYSFTVNEAGQEAARMGFGTEMMSAVIHRVIERIKEELKPGERSYIGFSLNAECLDTPVELALTSVADFSPDQLLQKIWDLGASDKHIEMDDALSIKVDLLNVDLALAEETGYGALNPRLKPDRLSRLEGLARRRYLYGRAKVFAQNDCGPVAFALSQLQRKYGSNYVRQWVFKTSHLRNFNAGSDYKFNRGHEEAPRELKREALRVANLFQPELDFDELQGNKFLLLLQEHMDTLNPPQQLVVFEDGSYKEPLFAGQKIRRIKDRVYFLLIPSVKHMALISEPGKFFSAELCDDCLGMAARQKVHACVSGPKLCFKCGTHLCRTRPQSRKIRHICEDCNTYFDRMDCLFYHKLGKVPRCASHATCPKCVCMVRRTELAGRALEDHKCLAYRCKYCKKDFRADDPDPHLCQIQPPRKEDLGGVSEDGQEPLFFRVYFDIETVKRGEDSHLVPYLTAGIFVCSSCVGDLEKKGEWKEEYPCCGRRQRVYWFEEGLRSFLKDTFGGRKDLKRGVCLAFNCRNFDGYFLISRLLAADPALKNTVIAGNRILSLTLNGVQVKDFNMYCQGSLASLPRSFGLDGWLEKGYFSHNFASSLRLEDMRTFRSPSFPDLSFYSPHTMKTEEEKRKLSEWHQSVKDNEFVFAAEAEKYCVQDAVILCLCSERLNKVVMDFTDGEVSLLNSETFTLAALTMTIYRQKYLNVPIGIIPNTGERRKKSLIANIYFRYLNRERERKGRPAIHFARNSVGGEFRVDRKLVDGHCPETNTFYEFDGCQLMAIQLVKLCYKDSTAIHPVYKIPYAAVRAISVRRIKEFGFPLPLVSSEALSLARIESEVGAKVICFRECQVMAQIKNSRTALHDFYQEQRLMVDVAEPISPRSMLAGGRTEVFAPYYKLTDDQLRQGLRIKHIDVCSLYPFVQFTMPFPSRAHPQIIDGSTLSHNGYNWTLEQVRQFFGVFSVALVYRKTPFYPPIPYKTRGKAIFGCCKACMIGNIQGKCLHTSLQDRAVKLVLTSVDLELALEHGASLLAIYEVHDYGRKNVSMDMFRGMMAPLVRGKLLAKGAGGRSKEQLEELAKAWEPFGIHLRPDDFPEDRAHDLYHVFKLLMNSLWGKLCQVNRTRKKQVLTSARAAAALLRDPCLRVTSVFEVGAGESLLVETESRSEDQPESHPQYNPVIGSFVTSYARRHLFLALLQCGDRALYCDTDSIIYVSHPDKLHREPQTDPWERLGGWVNELKKDEFISEFVASAPKCYEYVVRRLTALFGPAVGWKIRMKGLGLTSLISQELSVETLLGMILRQVPELRPYEAFLAGLAKEAGEEYTAVAREKTQATGELHIPQTRLTKVAKDMAIYDHSSSATKVLRFNFDKRVIEPQLFRPNSIPSYPFGTRDGDEVHWPQ